SLALSGATGKTGTATITKTGDGTITVSSNATGVATVSRNNMTITVTSVDTGSATVTVTMAAGTNYLGASCTISVSVTIINIFGVVWSYGSTSTALTRLTPSNDPSGYVNQTISTNPSPAVGTGAGSSPFDSFEPWSGMEEYNVISNAVSYKKGSSGFSRSSYDTMVKIPAFYFKIVEDSTNSKRYYYVASNPATGFTKHPGSDRYIGKYNTIPGHFSKSGNNPLTSTTRTSFRASARAKGNGWCLYDYASWCALWLLYLIEFADFNSQAKIGRGNVDSGSVQSNGGTDSMAYHTGRASGSDGSAQIQYRNVENPWGNVCDWVDGANFLERAAYLCTNPANYADDTYANYTAAGVTLCPNGWIRNIGVSSSFPWAFLPSANGGSETTCIPDYVYSDAGWRALFVGGGYGYGSYAGLFYFVADNAASGTYSPLGARLLFVP
ncbi:MAG: hypothetical protein RSD95_17165, partial [Clostridia bacterium]